MKQCLILVVAWFAVCSLPAAERPNVVFIISDDQTYTDYGFMGNAHVRTPNLDALAARSARYVNGYVPSSVCRPSLATMLTGLYPHQHRIHFNHPPPGFRQLGQIPSADAYHAARAAAVQLFQRSPTLPAILAKAGYVSFQAGKHWEGTYKDAGFSEGMTRQKPCFEQPWNRKLSSGEWVAHGNGDAGLIIGRKTLQPVFDFVDRNLDQPFLLWYAPVLPHEPHNAPQKYRDLYKRDPDVASNRLPYYANITWFDDTVGQLLDHLDKKGLTGNTLFVYVSDNGWTPCTDSPKQNNRSKRSPFEDGLRTPILLQWADVIKPATYTELVSSIDLVPTVLSAVGIDPAEFHLPGVDLMPSARRTAALDPDRPVFGEIYPGDASSLGHPERDIAYRWVRQGRWKLIVPQSHNGKRPWNEYVKTAVLFDVVNDPIERNDLSHDAKYATDYARLSKLLSTFAVTLDPPGR